jgi:CheY-like chemotaxis protein
VPKILVADDNSNIQKMVALALKDQGIDVVAVGNGEAAVRKLPDIFPDLVLADVFMPVRNGYEVCEFVKKDPRFAHVPVILLVGAFDPLDEQEAQRVGADGVLKKPFVPPEPLINMVKSALEKSAAEHLVPVTAGATPPAASGYAPQPSGISSAAPFSVPSPAAMDSAAPAGKQAPPPAAPKPEEEPLDRFGMPPSPVALSGDDHPLAFRQLLETETQAEAGKPHPEPPSFQGAGFNVMRFLNETKAGPEADTADAAAREGHEGPTWGGSGTALPHGDDASLVGQIDWDSEKSHGHASEEAATEPPSAFGGANVEPIAWGKNPLPWADAEEHPAAEAPVGPRVGRGTVSYRR